ncbi:MAG: hypothetical protein Q8M98_04760 [Candidatus Cloacimonadaceae bacterium]|nr:hypothetical protein [Candidatus Cloacimonadaceae bacterium]
MTFHELDNKLKISFVSLRGSIIAGSFGGVLFGINFTLQLLVGMFRLTGASGFLTGLTVPFFLAIASRMNRQWGTATIIWTLYSFLAIPTELMGVPGPYKLLVGFMGGLAYDVGYCGLKCKPFALYIALILYVVMLSLGFYVVFITGLVQDIVGGSILKILTIVPLVFIIEGMLSTFAASRFMKKYSRLFGL